MDRRFERRADIAVRPGGGAIVVRRIQWPANAHYARIERARLACALLLSLALHALLLTLTFGGGQGLWLLGFNLPWQDRRFEMPDLRVALTPPPVVVAPVQKAQVEPPIATAPVTRSAPRARSAAGFAGGIVPQTKSTEDTKPAADAPTVAATAEPALRAEPSVDLSPLPMPAPRVIALVPNNLDTWVVPAIPDVPTPPTAAAPSVQAPIAKADD